MHLQEILRIHHMRSHFPVSSGARICTEVRLNDLPSIRTRAGDVTQHSLSALSFPRIVEHRLSSFRSRPGISEIQLVQPTWDRALRAGHETPTDHILDIPFQSFNSLVA